MSQQRCECCRTLRLWACFEDATGLVQGEGGVSEPDGPYPAMITWEMNAGSMLPANVISNNPSARASADDAEEAGMETEEIWDGDELVRWAERYGHPEEWVKRAQAAHNRAENLYRDLETVRRYHGEEITAKARLIGVIIRLRQVYSPEGVGVWLFSVNRKLDGQVPWTLMVDGRLDEVERALPPLD